MTGPVVDVDKAVASLLDSARAASDHAYSPYSEARVGACVLDEDGNIHSGCNVESASYGLTQCAERNALASAISAGMRPGGAHVLLIFASGFEVLSPCGACRQVMSELLPADAVVISCVSDSEYRYWSVSELLPDPFILK